MGGFTVIRVSTSNLHLIIIVPSQIITYQTCNFLFSPRQTPFQGRALCDVPVLLFRTPARLLLTRRGDTRADVRDRHRVPHQSTGNQGQNGPRERTELCSSGAASCRSPGRQLLLKHQAGRLCSTKRNPATPRSRRELRPRDVTIGLEQRDTEGRNLCPRKPRGLVWQIQQE